MVPVELHHGKCTRKIEPHDPRAASAGWPPAAASVSPVGQKKNVSKPEPGRNLAFSGRLNGVADFAFASALASNGAKPSVAVSCTSTQVAGQEVPGGGSFSCASENVSATGSAAWKTIGAPSIETCSANRRPPKLTSAR